MASVSGVVYIDSADGLLWIGNMGHVRHPSAVLTPADLSRVNPGDRVTIVANRLHVAPETVIRLDGSTVWSPPVIHPAAGLAYAPRTRSLLDSLIRTIPPLQLSSGLAQLVPELPFLVQGLETAGSGDQLAVIGRRILRKFSQSFLTDQVENAGEAAAELLGLGPGLTPSGDDFLGGLWFVLDFAGQQQVMLPAWVPYWREQLLERAATATNRISYGLLCHYANHDAPEPLYWWMHALFSAGSLPELVSRSRELLAIGHSSGGDLLAGLIFGVLLILSWPPVADRAMLTES